jgi:hypothetical protein
VKFKGEVLPGEQPAIVERELFEAVQAKLPGQESQGRKAEVRGLARWTDLR